MSSEYKVSISGTVTPLETVTLGDQTDKVTVTDSNVDTMLFGSMDIELESGNYFLDSLELPVGITGLISHGGGMLKFLYVKIKEGRTLLGGEDIVDILFDGNTGATNSRVSLDGVGSFAMMPVYGAVTSVNLRSHGEGIKVEIMTSI